MAIFENQYYQLRIKEGGDCFEIIAAQSNLPQLTGSRAQILGKLSNGRKFKARVDLKNCIKSKDEKHEQVIIYAGRHAQSGIDWRISFVLVDDQPLVFWRVQITNQSSSPLFIDKIILLESSQSDTGNVLFPESNTQKDLAFYSNGWQSWSFTGAYSVGERMRRTNLGLLQKPMVYNPGTPKFRSAGRFSSDFFGVLGDRQSRGGMLLGFLSQKNHFGSITADIRRNTHIQMWANGDNARLDPQTTITTDWAAMSVFNIDERDPLAPYLNAVGEENAVCSLPPTPAGWCSWYYYYENISPEIIRGNLQAIKNNKEILPLVWNWDAK